MRYLVSALAAAREENRQFKEAYAFVPFGYGDGAPATQADAEQEWIAKGLVPLAYKSDRGHSALWDERSEEHTSELQSLMRISYAVFCLKKKTRQTYKKLTRITH